MVVPHYTERTATAVRAGVPRSVAMAMVGQNTEAIYRRYAIVSAGDLLRAARQLDDAAGIVRTGTDRGASDDPGLPEENVARPAGLLL